MLWQVIVLNFAAYSGFMPWNELIADQTQLNLYIILAGVFLIQMLFILYLTGGFVFRRKKTESVPGLPVSVVVCAKNEYYNLEQFLPAILNQDYPEFEVVVVNDDSDDDTSELLGDMARKYPRLRVIELERNLNFFSGKKFPLSIGIRSAAHDIVLLTDADCVPAGPGWIRRMQAHFADSNIQMVLGYGAYEKSKGLLNRLIRYDTLSIAQQYFSMACSGIPYMGVGRNLAYRKSFFMERKGFISHYSVNSGDDDLFVNKNANKTNTAIEFSAESHTVSIPQKSFQHWIIQKKRHNSSGRHYRFLHKFLLFMFPLSTLAFYGFVAAVAALYPALYTIIPVGALVILRIGLQLMMTKKAMNRLNERNLLLFSPIFEIFLIFFNGMITLSNLFKPQTRWR